MMPNSRAREERVAEKKEVLEYLRNQQKAAEIDAKVNGINSWVLLGAMALIAWHLLGTAELLVWSDHELLARVLVAVQGALFVVRACGVRGQQGGSVRFTSWRLKDMDTPFLDIVHGLVLLGPTGFLIALYKDYTALLAGIVGLVFFLSGCAALVRLIRGDDLDGEKFPEPSFGNSQRTNSFMSLFFMLGWIFLFIYQSRLAMNLLQEPQIEHVKVLAGVAVLYALLLLAIQRRAFGESIRWTYALETELLLDNVTPDVALRRIEHRALGPRLQDVMDRFFDGLDRKFAALESLRDDCLKQLKEVSSVPKEYVAERNARINAATERCDAALAELDSDCKELSGYLGRLKVKNVMDMKSSIATHIKGIEARQSIAVQRLQELREWLKRSKREPMGE